MKERKSYRAVRPTWSGFAFPKKEKKAVKPKNAKPEKELQEFANKYYAAIGIKFLRLYDELFSVIAMSSNNCKYWLQKELKGWPDNILFIPVGDKYNLVFCPELKKKGKNLSSGQVLMAEKINMKMFDDQDILIEAVNEFKKAAEKIDEYFNGRCPYCEYRHCEDGDWRHICNNKNNHGSK